MKIRRKHNPTDIKSIAYYVKENETRITKLVKCKIQIKFVFWITVKVYYIDVLLKKIKH